MTPPDVFAVADQRQQVVHLVREGRPDGSGWMVGVCGQTFLPASLIAPLGPTCRLCDAAARPGLPTPRTTWMPSIFGRRHPARRSER